MNLTITGHHLEVTPALRDYITSKLDRVRRHFDQVVDITVVLSVEKLRQHAEINVHVRGKDLFAQATDGDLYAAIDALMDKLDRQVIKYKEIRQDHTHEPPRRQEAS